METTHSDHSELPQDPQRVRAFAVFFKRYISLSALVTAALPIPITAFQLIPTFASQRRVLSVYTALFCFLVLAFIFYSRHSLARMMFPHIRHEPLALMRFAKSWFVNGMPAALIFLSLFCLVWYHWSVEQLLDVPAVSQDAQGRPPTREELLERITPSPPEVAPLMALYLGIFVFAEAAFVLMAVREYLQDVLGLTDTDIIIGPRAEAQPGPIEHPETLAKL